MVISRGDGFWEFIAWRLSRRSKSFWHEVCAPLPSIFLGEMPRLERKLPPVYLCETGPDGASCRLKWLASTCVAGMVGVCLIGVAIYASLNMGDGSGMMSSLKRASLAALQPVRSATLAKNGQSANGQKEDRIQMTAAGFVSRQVIHIDFQRVQMDQKVRVAVPIELVGTAYGVKTEGGMLDFVTREVHVECLPADIPKHIELDVTNLHVGQHVEAKDLKLPSDVTLLEDPDRVIVALGHSRLEAAPAVAEAAEGEAAEPEVIKKTKAEE